MTPIWTLHGSGRRTADQWNLLASHEPTMSAAWADLDGFHVTDTLPTTPPTTTHLWAWTHHCWLRVRVDHTSWWAALLTRDEPRTGTPLWPHTQPPPEVHTQNLLHWSPHSGEVLQRHVNPDNALTSLTMIQLTPLRVTTATFIGTTDTNKHD